MGWFPRVHPLRWPGDHDPPVGKRSRSDWLVLAALLADLVLFVIHFVPGLRRDEPSTASLVFLLGVLFMIWLGPFLGLLLRRGRGVALLAYGITKLGIAMAVLGWWWGHGLAGESAPLGPLAPSIGWHLLGAAVALIALTRHHSLRPRPVNETL